MEYIITTDDKEDIKIGVEGIEDILQCLRMLLGIIEGKVFLDRRLGISSEVIDGPLNKMNKCHEEIYQKIEEFEPRVEITSIKINTDNLEGRATIAVGVKMNEEYI